MQNIKVSRFKSCRVETDGRTDTTDRITFLANAVGKYSAKTENHPLLGRTGDKPRRRRFGAFTTEAKIIRRIRRRVALFPTAAARQFFRGGDCDAANAWLISLPISLKHDGNTSRLGLFDCRLSWTNASVC